MKQVGSFLVFVALWSCSAQKPDLSPDQVRAAVQLAEMWGHLEASKANADSGNWAMALAHATHPLVENFPIVRPALSPESARNLEEALELYRMAVEKQDRFWKGAWFQAQMGLSAALTELLGTPRENPRAQALVVRALLDRFAGEYQEAWGTGEKNLAEYQDARGYLRVTRALYGEIGPQTERKDTAAHAVIWQGLNDLTASLSPLSPSTAPVPLDQVNERVRRIQAALTRVWDLPPQESTPEELLHMAKAKLTEALEAYKDGDAERAYEAAVGAYLNGFEGLERALLEKGAQELVLQVEGLFRELREGIRQNRPFEEVQQTASRLQKELQKTAEILQ